MKLKLLLLAALTLSICGCTKAVDHRVKLVEQNWTTFGSHHPYATVEDVETHERYNIVGYYGNEKGNFMVPIIEWAQ